MNANANDHDIDMIAYRGGALGDYCIAFTREGLNYANERYVNTPVFVPREFERMGSDISLERLRSVYLVKKMALPGRAWVVK